MSSTVSARDWTAYARLLGELLSGERAQAHVEGLAPFYRSPGSSGYDASIDYVLEALDGAGLDVEVVSVPLDGRTAVLEEPTTRAWEPRAARLEVVGPEPETLVSWDSCPSCLPWWCRPTPEEGVELELVDVGTGTREEDFEGRDVAGKAVLVHDAVENFAWYDIVARAARHGAAGVVSNYLLYQYEPWRTRAAVPDAVQQLRLSSRGESPWAFTIAQPAFERLSGLLADGRVTVRFTIDAATYESASRYVVATIRGEERPDDGVLFVAHVTAATKPGANCASGVGLMIEMARTMQELVAGGRIPRPRRSIRFLFGAEGLSSTHWYESSPEQAAGVVAAIAFCSVGHDEGATKSSLVMARSPDSLPTFVNDLLETVIEEAPRDAPWAYRAGSSEISLMHWTVLPYTPWSDNATWSKLGVPGLLFMSLPDRYFHTQLLTPDKTDPAVFRRCGAVTGAAALTAATAEWPEVGDILRDVARRSRARVEALAIRAARAAREGRPEDARRTLDAIDWMLERDGLALRSALVLVPESAGDDRAAAEVLVEELEREARAAVAWTSAFADEAPANGSPADGLVPRRARRAIPHGIPGLAYGEMVAHAARMAEVDPGVGVETLQIVVDEIWNLSTGRWNLEEITRIVGHEFSLQLRPADVHRLAEGLAEAGYVELTPRRGGD